MAKTMASLRAFPSSLLPRAWSRALIPFPFPFERLPRRLGAQQSRRLREVVAMRELTVCLFVFSVFLTLWAPWSISNL